MTCRIKPLRRPEVLVALIDVQEKLLPTMPSGERVGELAGGLRQMRLMLHSATVLGLPMLATEQYPKGLGPTIAPLRAALPTATPVFEKVAFSCARVEGVMQTLQQRGSKQVILLGMETHICVTQSALGLLQAGYEVWVAQDACLSRSRAAWKAGLRLMGEAGAVVAPTETLVFMLMEQSGTDEFRQISRFLKDLPGSP